MSRLLIALCFLIHAQTPSIGRLYPLDETSRDPQFRSYFCKLRNVVKTRDVKALHKLVDEDVVIGPADEDKGWSKFAAKWHPDDRDHSPLWPALSDMLSLGCIREHPSLFLSPYLVWRFPRELNPAMHLVVIRDKVALRDAPSPKASSVESLSFDIVQQLARPQRGEDQVQWVHVRTLDGKSGYLNIRDVMSPLIPRAQFGKRRGHWALIALEGGDE